MEFLAILLVSDKCKACQQLVKTIEFKSIIDYMNNYTCFAILDIDTVREFCKNILSNISTPIIRYDDGFLRILTTITEPSFIYATRQGKWKVIKLDFENPDQIRVKSIIIRNIIKMIILENPDKCKSIRGRKGKKKTE